MSVTKAEMAEALQMDLAMLEKKSATVLINKRKGQCVFGMKKTPVSHQDNTHCQV